LNFKIHHKKNSEKGSALIVVLMFSVFASLAILSMQNVVESDQSLASKLNLDSEYINLLHDIKNTIGNDSFCNDPTVGLVGLTLATGRNLNSLTPPTTLRISIPGANQAAIGPGWMNSSRTLRFHRMRWIHQNQDPDSFARASAVVRSRKSLYHLIVEMKRCKSRACNEADSQFFTNAPRADGTINNNAIHIPLFIHLESNNRYITVAGVSVPDFLVRPNAAIVSCFAEGTGADFCEQTGSTWNPYASDMIYKCEPKNHCYYKRALPNDTCGTNPEVTLRYKPIVEGKGKMLPGRTPPSSPNVRVPATDFDPNRLNVMNCSWCNPNI
jgi:hypothetical protein